MAKLTKEELLKKVNDLFGEEATDEQLGILEDISDSFDSEDNKELETTKAELEKTKTDLKEFRKKYRDRFLNGVGNEPSEKDKADEMHEETENEEQKLNYDDLFTTEK